MADKALLAALKSVESRIHKSAESYRKYVSNFETHDIEISASTIIKEVTKEMLSREGADTLPKSTQNIIKQEVTAMCGRLYSALHPKKFNTDRKKYITSEMKGTPTNFSVVYATKTGYSGSVFNAFKRLKQKEQKPLIKALNANIKTLNRGSKRQRETIDSRKGFLDIGHADASSVGRQRAGYVQQTLFEFGGGNSSNKLVNKLISELSDGIDLTLQKLDVGPPTDTIKISMESKAFNRASMTKNEITDLNKQLKIVIENMGGEYWAGLSGSDSTISKATKIIVKEFTKPLKGKKGVKIKTINTTIKRSSGKTQKETNKSKGSKKAYKDAAIGATATRTRAAKPAFNPLAIVTAINKELPATVRKNMGAPALENQTGRFAESVRVTDIMQTARGFPSIGYTYQRNPYEVYETGSGSRFASDDRDPRKIIDQSIREIAAQFMMGRFYTRRQ